MLKMHKDQGPLAAWVGFLQQCVLTLQSSLGVSGLDLPRVALTLFFSRASWEAKDGMKRNLVLAMSTALSSVELVPVDLEEGRMGLPSILEYPCGPSDPVASLSRSHWKCIGHVVCRAHWASPVVSCEPSPSLQPSL